MLTQHVRPPIFTPFCFGSCSLPQPFGGLHLQFGCLWNGRLPGFRDTMERVRTAEEEKHYFHKASNQPAMIVQPIRLTAASCIWNTCFHLLKHYDSVKWSVTGDIYQHEN
jgi:hypothetical protein